MFPETVLNTERLTLRAFTDADIEDARASCGDALTQRRLPLPRPYTLDDATAWCTGVEEDRLAGPGERGRLLDIPPGPGPRDPVGVGPVR